MIQNTYTILTSLSSLNNTICARILISVQNSKFRTPFRANHLAHPSRCLLLGAVESIRRWQQLANSDQAPPRTAGGSSRRSNPNHCYRPVVVNN